MKLLEKIQRPGFPGHFFALVMGGLLPFNFAPYYIWPLVLFSVAGLYFSLKGLSSKAALWRGWWFGFGAYAVGASWVYISIHVHSYTPAVPAFFMTLFFVAGLAWFFALMTWCYQKWFSQNRLPWLSFAAVWALFEWTRSWFLTGFPWLYLGDALVSTPLAGWAPIFGVYSLGFLIVLTAAVVIDQLRSPTFVKLTLPLLLTPWLAGFAFFQINWTTPQIEEPITVVAVQGNIPQERKWLAEEIFPTLEKYRGASVENWDTADLVLWPETAVTILYHQAKEYLGVLNEEAEKSNTTLITGIPYQQGADEPIPGAYHNSIMAIGQGAGIYHKQRLVPFGEYMPLPESWRSMLEFFNIPMSEFRVGEAEQSLLFATSKGVDYKVAPFICYEVVYPDFVADMAGESGLMVTISNDAWFGDSIGPLQHLGSVRMRALENGRYMLRSTNTGVTALINPKGEIVERLPQFEYGVLKAEAQVLTGLTPFGRWGSWPVIILCFGILLRMRLSRESIAAIQSQKNRV